MDPDRSDDSLRPYRAVSAVDAAQRRFGLITRYLQAELELEGEVPTWNSPMDDTVLTFFMKELPHELSSDAFQQGILPRLSTSDISIKPSVGLIIFKFFDIRSQQLSFVGSNFVDLSLTIRQVCELKLLNFEWFCAFFISCVFVFVCMQLSDEFRQIAQDQGFPLEVGANYACCCEVAPVAIVDNPSAVLSDLVAGCSNIYCFFEQINGIVFVAAHPFDFHS